MGRRGSRLPSPTIQQGNERVGDGRLFSCPSALSKVNSRSFNREIRATHRLWWAAVTRSGGALRIGSGTGKCINSVVFRVAAVTFHPAPFDSVRRRGRDKFLPQLGILDRLLVRSAPAVALPIVDPARDPVADIDAVGVKLDAARPGKCLEPFDRGDQFHAIVGGQRFAARQLALLVVLPKQNAPAAGPRIAAAGAIGEQLDFRQLGQGAARVAA